MMEPCAKSSAIPISSIVSAEVFMLSLHLWLMRLPSLAGPPRDLYLAVDGAKQQKLAKAVDGRQVLGRCVLRVTDRGGGRRGAGFRRLESGHDQHLYCWLWQVRSPGYSQAIGRLRCERPVFRKWPQRWPQPFNSLLVLAGRSAEI